MEKYSSRGIITCYSILEVIFENTVTYVFLCVCVNLAIRKCFYWFRFKKASRCTLCLFSFANMEDEKKQPYPGNVN